MKRLLLVSGTVLLFAGVAGVGWYVFVRQTEPPVEWSEDLQAAANANNRFALDLYGKLAADEKQKGQNVFFSPYSVHAALAMAATGAKGNTREQMTRVLYLPDDTNLLAAGDVGRFYGHPRKHYELSVANALWGRKGFPWRQEFLDVQKARFGAGLREADFAANPDTERDRINRWVEKQTRDRIKELLLPGQVNPATTLVLVNAIYFKGKWAKPFDPKSTHNEPFHCDAETKIDVPMMHASPKCGYADVDGVTMAELPYQGDELSMLVILPKPSDDLAALEKALTPELFAKWSAKLGNRAEMSVTLPKFRIESRYELPRYLQALGVTDAFQDGAADFTGMATESPGYISAVAHKAFVDVSEEGTEAAAATGATFQFISATVRPAFSANRPFLFLIRDNQRGTILFVGRVMKP